MKLIQKVGAMAVISALSFASCTAMAGTFSIKRPYVLYYLDGTKTSFSFVRDSSSFPLEVGKHQIVIRFEGAFREGRETRVVTSEPVVINFDIADPSIDYSIEFDYPRNFEKATNYAANPTITLIDSNGNAVSDAEIFVLPHKSGMQIGRDYLREIADLGKAYKSDDPKKNVVVVSNANAATLDKQKTFELNPNADTDKKVAPALNPSSSDATYDNAQLEQLKKLYLEADPETRKLFRVWMVSGE